MFSAGLKNGPRGLGNAASLGDGGPLADLLHRLGEGTDDLDVHAILADPGGGLFEVVTQRPQAHDDSDRLVGRVALALGLSQALDKVAGA